ncbi:MAG: glycosyltransferase family 39 protein, partial [Anaerolineae bacterium]|nr:glycosyltransferase family 39 protein [Anaerolineae bacterium]
MRTAVLLLLILWLSRIPALESLPLHNDEGLHLTRAVEVWNLHPFWEIRDGKIINHWAIALFYPQNAPVFAGRIATIFVSLIGFAAGYALARRLFGATPALLAGALWITSPYLFFFERLALSDAEAGALVMLALWAGWRLAERGTIRQAVIAGLALALAALFKFTAVPFAAAVALVVLLRARYPVGRRILMLIIAGIVVAVCFAVPIGYLVIRGDDLFSIALGWIGGGSGG